jgi:hypothetical protein
MLPLEYSPESADSHEKRSETMGTHPGRTARAWFEEAVRVYVEGHQACAWCGSRHLVYKGRRGNRVEYYCPGCDFYAFHDPSTGQYFAAAGRDEANLPQPARASTSQTTTVLSALAAAAVMPSGENATDVTHC